jgi:hypothetical protein
MAGWRDAPLLNEETALAKNAWEAAPLVGDTSQERGFISPYFRNSRGEMQWAVPHVLNEVGNALTVPGKAFRGHYGMSEDEAGVVRPITDEMIGDAVGTAALAPMSGVASMAPQGLKTLAGARNAVGKQLRTDGVPAQQVGPRLAEIGDSAMVADLTPGTQAMAQGLASHQGPGQAIMVDALRARNAAANMRVQRDVNATLGPTPTPSAIKADITANKQALSPAYEEALKAAQPVDTSRIASALDQDALTLRGKGQQVASQVRDMLNVTGTKQLDTSPRTLLQTREAIDGMLAAENNTSAIRVLAGVRVEVDELLAQSVPGIKQVDARFADLARQQTGLDDGARVLDTGRTAIRPEEMATVARQGVVPEGLLVGPSGQTFRMSQGARAEIDRIIGTNINDKVALRKILKGDGSWNRDRLTSLFGREKTDRLLGIMEREARFAETANPALGGSRTEVVRSAAEQLNRKAPTEGIIENLLNMKVGTAAAKTADKLAGGKYSAEQARRNALIAEILTSGPNQEMALSIGKPTGRNPYGPAENAVVRALVERKANETKNRRLGQGLLGRRMREQQF